MLVECVKYDTHNNLFALATENFQFAETSLILIGGMYDGPFSLHYSEMLHLACQQKAKSTSLIQPLFRSSYRQFGISTLDDDANDLYQLLSTTCISTKRIILVGHSSGCNGILHFLGRFLPTLPFSKEVNELQNKILGIVLQGPVSDSQYITSVLGKERVDDLLAMANELIFSGQAESIMPMGSVPMEPIVPITAKRLHSLIIGDDEMFSIGQDGSILFTLSKTYPVLIFLSEKDEYVPLSYAEMSGSLSIISFFSQISSLHPKNEVIFVPNANHGLSNMSKDEIISQFLNPIFEWIDSL